MSTINEISTANKAAIARRERVVVWGFPLEFWSSVIVWATAIAAIAGAISVAAGFVAGIVGYQVSDITQKQTEARIAEANARAETAKLQSAEANSRAVEAALALEKYKAPRTLEATDIDTIRTALRQFSKQNYQVTTFWELQEPFAFSEQLHRALNQAGWIFVPHGSGGSFLLGSLSGVQVWIHPNSSPSAKEAADALVRILSQLNLAPTLKIQEVAAPVDNIVRLNVGTKN